MQRMVRATTGFPPASATRIELLVDGSRKYPRLLEDIAAATREIHVEYYIYEPDQNGTRLRDALVDAARRGVKVRLLRAAAMFDRLGRQVRRQRGGFVGQG